MSGLSLSCGDRAPSRRRRQRVGVKAINGKRSSHGPVSHTLDQQRPGSSPGGALAERPSLPKRRWRSFRYPAGKSQRVATEHAELRVNVHIGIDFGQGVVA